MTLLNSDKNDFYKYGYWIGKKFLPEMYCKKKEGLYYFNGIIATYRKYKRKQRQCTYVTIGYDNGKYLDLIFEGTINLYNKNCISGVGELNTSNYGIEVSEYTIKKF